ncbi:aspartyl/asparaginyl beta-hydroxylase domain-containing protein [Pseudomonas nitroreducens]|uniref:aspartyl/asparaginyl beta-hydroxylase domain-containing protein n=1 Tax=Pseudomonas nitroreducens TaxID=46680 RepID=UPI0004BCB400|nr:aspartyl/asparaginyl beta-hydroxylase domain-containing protein [Pseudomonas nitroreducens]
MASDFRLPACARLPLRFSTQWLEVAVAALPASAWVTHFNTAYHTGGWSGISLLAPEDSNHALSAGQGSGTQPPCATRWYGPPWQELLRRIEMPVRCARLLRLEAGSSIREHCDPDLGDPEGDVRLHLPIFSGPGVEFLLEGQVVPMAPGECWFLDLARPHRVENVGEQARVHLVVDARRNDWLRRQITRGLQDTPACRPARSTLAFAEFRRQLERRADLAAALRDLQDPRDFCERAVALGAGLGLRFQDDDVRAAMRQGRQAWLDQRSY